MERIDYIYHIHLIHAPDMSEEFRSEWIEKNCPFSNPLHTASSYIKDNVLNILSGEKGVTKHDEETQKEIDWYLDQNKQYQQDLSLWLNHSTTLMRMEVDWRITFANEMLEALKNKEDGALVAAAG